MFIYIVNINVLPECVEQFKNESLENAKNTVKEPKNIRFDVLQQDSDSTKFVLYEVYTDESGLEEHKKTQHYNKWKTTVDPMMAEKRVATKLTELFFGKE
ncbi:MAG: antibiotic biosynthesis monooxygenase [Planctomycetaceae bacterium]|jgi:quinol monooxygenase YgiN|nr:antibiotic biosynthesis monooxygenase [Planctomycetaceae bacterium]